MRKVTYFCDICGKPCNSGVHEVGSVTSNELTLAIEIKSASISVSRELSKNADDVCSDCIIAAFENPTKVIR